jgi:hypothetical protein
MLRHKSKMQFAEQERNTQNAIALLNYLKRIAPQQLMLSMQVFTKNFLAQRSQVQRFKIKLFTLIEFECLQDSYSDLQIPKIWT